MAELPPDNPVEEEEQTETTEEEVQAEEDEITDQVVPSFFPGDAPMSPVMYNHHRHHVVPQAPLRPVVYNHHQYQAFPNAVPGQAPMIRPTTNNQNQDQVVPNVVPGQAPMTRPVTNNQNYPMANQMANQVSMQPPFPLLPNHTYNPRPVFVAAQNFFNPQYHLNVTPFRHIQYPYLRPEDNNQNLIMPRFRNDQVFTTTSPSGEVRSYAVLQDPWNSQQYFVMSLDDAVVLGPSTQQQLQPMLSQGFNTGPSSE